MLLYTVTKSVPFYGVNEAINRFSAGHVTGFILA